MDQRDKTRKSIIINNLSGLLPKKIMGQSGTQKAPYLEVFQKEYS